VVEPLEAFGKAWSVPQVCLSFAVVVTTRSEKRYMVPNRKSRSVGQRAPSRAVLSVNRPRRLWIKMPVFTMSPEPRIPIRKGTSLPRAPANGFQRGVVVGEGGRQFAEGPGLSQKVLRFLLGRFHGVGAGDPSPRRGGLAGDLHKALG